MHGDGGHRCACARAGAEYPARRRGRKEERRERNDQQQPRHDERQPADERANPAAQPPRAIDRKLRRGRPRQQVAGGNRVLEVLPVQPASADDTELAKEGDMRRWATEADAADTPPLPHEH